MPIDAIAAVGPEWNINIPELSSPGGIDGASGVDGLDGVSGAGGAGGKGFGGMLADQIDSLQGLQTEAATQSQALATGQAADASQVVLSVERAQLAMQLAANLRDKSVESFQEIFRTQV
jgi:flagellar hook-basal body complex protein FliE